MKKPVTNIRLDGLLIIGVIFTALEVVAQSNPGMYLTMDLELEICDHKLKLLNTEEVYCLSEEPIIKFDLLEKVEEMVYDSLFEMRKFRIVMTTKGANYISTVAKKLPDLQIGLVVNGILVSIIDLEGIYNARSIIIWDYNDSQAMDWVHRSLVRMVEKSYKKS